MRRSDASGKRDGLDRVGAEGVYALAQQRLELLIPGRDSGEGSGAGAGSGEGSSLLGPPATGRRPYRPPAI